jgi:hypothetical protein
MAKPKRLQHKHFLKKLLVEERLVITSLLFTHNVAYIKTANKRKILSLVYKYHDSAYLTYIEEK